MDQEALVAEFRRLLLRLEPEVGPVGLLLLVNSDEASNDSWNVIVSAAGYNHKSIATAVRELTATMREVIGKAFWPRISRVTVLKTDDPFVLAFKSTYSALPPGATLRSLYVAGVELPKAVIVEAKRRAA